MNPRLKLALIAALFLLPFVAAVVLRFGGWEPPRTRNHGELLQPPLPMQSVRATRADGSIWVFENVDRQWTLLLRVPQKCAAECVERIAVLHNVRVALGRHAGKLHPFRFGAVDQSHPDAAAALAPFAALDLQGGLPAPLQGAAPATLPEAWLVDPHGYLVMHYAPGFDPGGMRRDLARLVR